MNKSATILSITFHQPKRKFHWDDNALLRPLSTLVLGESHEM
jgi:hypothetical protein